MIMAHLCTGFDRYGPSGGSRSDEHSTSRAGIATMGARPPLVGRGRVEVHAPGLHRPVSKCTSTLAGVVPCREWREWQSTDRP